MMEVTNVDDYLKEAMSEQNDENANNEISFIQSKLENIDKDIKTISNIVDKQSLYTPTISQSRSHIIFVALVTFHQKKGSIIESTFPDESILLEDPFIASLNSNSRPKDILIDLFDQLSRYCIFDGIHLVDSDKEYFLIQNMSEVLYCVSSYKQIQASECELEDDSENKRNYIQKAICIVSTLPLFEYFATQATVAIEEYFNQKSLKDKSIISNLYNYLITRSYCQINDYQLVSSFDVYSVVLFCKEKIFSLIKLILLEKRIIVYSKIPGDVCGFILSLLSLCVPGGSLFNYPNKGLCYRELGLPLQCFNFDHLFAPLFALSDLNVLNSKRSFFIGITNNMILESKEMKYDCLINIDENSITFGKDIHERLLHMSKRELICHKQLQDIINKDGEQCFSDNHLWLRKETIYLKENEDIVKKINNYINNLLFDISLGIELCQRRLNNFNELIFENLLTNESSTDCKSIGKCLLIILCTYNIDFIVQWIQTLNFSKWYKSIFSQYLSYRSIFYKCIDDLCIHYINEDYYSGTLKEGKFHFKGQYYYHDIDQTYIGEWENNKRNGVGNLTNKDNSYIYEGQWHNNKKAGIGYMISDGTKYGGSFVNDLYHGEGELIEKDGKRYKGTFNKGKKNGKGRELLSNEDEYEGYFENDYYEGIGVLTTKDKIKYIGRFSKGNLEGNVQIQFPNDNQVYLAVYQNGRNLSPEVQSKINLFMNNNIR